MIHTYLDYSISSGPFLRFPISFEFISEMFDHSVSETRDLSLTISHTILFIEIMVLMKKMTFLPQYCILSLDS